MLKRILQSEPCNCNHLGASEKDEYLGYDTFTFETEQNLFLYLLYSFIRNLTASHGRADEILSLRKRNLTELYHPVGLS